MNEIENIRMLGKRTIVVTVCLLLVLSPFYAAPSATSATAQFNPRYGGTLRIGYATDPLTWNPFTTSLTTSSNLHRQVYSTLGTYDDLYNIVGDLMKSYSVASEPGYPTVYTIELEHNVRWHDGHPLTAEDVKFTYETAAWGAQERDDAPDPALNDRLEIPVSRAVQYFGTLKKIEIVNDYTLKFYFGSLSLPIWLPQTGGSSYIVPKHLWGDFNKNNSPGQTFEDNQYNKMPVGAGPFKVADHVPDQYVIMDRNEDYFRGLPYLEHLVWTINPDRAAVVLALENGEIDTVHMEHHFPEEEIMRVNNLPEFTVEPIPYTTTWRIRLNQHPDAIARWPWLGDINVKKALEYAINKEGICNQVLFGITKPTYTPISWIVAPYGGDYNTAEYGYTGEWRIEPRKYNPDTARQLLTDAGWTLNAQGIRHKVIDGKDYILNDLQMPYYHYATAWADAITRYWSDIGIICESVPVESPTFYQGFELSEMGLEDVGMGGPYPMSMNTMGAGPDPEMIADWIEIRDEWGPGYKKGRENFGWYSNPRVDELLEQGRATNVYTERKAIYDEMQYLIHEDVGWIFLFNKWRTEGWNNDFAGFGANRPLAWYGSYFRGNQSMSNVEDGVYWRGGSPTPVPETSIVTSIITSVATTTQVVPEFLDLRLLAVFALILVVGLFISRRRKKEMER